jgi:tetratricopeptide (TPR) repeat protein
LLELLGIDPDNLQARTELSKIYQSLKKWDAAEKILLECLGIDPDNLQARTELSKIYQRQKKWDAAEKILLECLQIEPDDLNSRTELSRIYQEKGNFETAERLLKECIEINSEDPNSLLELGKICSRDPIRYNDAEKYFQYLASVEPDNIYAKTELASLYFKMRKFPAREKLLFEMYGSHPHDIPTLVALSRVFVRFRKFRIAIKLLLHALDCHNSDLGIFCELITVYRKVLDRENVEKYAKMGNAILSLDPYNKYAGRFRQLDLGTDTEITLTEFHQTGIYDELEDGQKCIECSGKRYPQKLDATANYRIRVGDKVFFGIYIRRTQEFADFIEPYFENMDQLGKLK